MAKIVSITDFKAHCLRLIDEMQQDGEPLTITRRGKVVAQVTPRRDAALAPVFGALRNDAYRFDDPFAPVSDMAEWDAGNPADLYRRG